MSKPVNNLVCMRHPNYNSDDSPDLTCKVCCSKFVARIRAEQTAQFEATWKSDFKNSNDDFQAMKIEGQTNPSKRHANFDGSWI